jgi:hypothetical protein
MKKWEFVSKIFEVFRNYIFSKFFEKLASKKDDSCNCCCDSCDSCNCYCDSCNCCCDSCNCCCDSCDSCDFCDSCDTCDSCDSWDSCDVCDFKIDSFRENDTLWCGADMSESLWNREITDLLKTEFLIVSQCHTRHARDWSIRICTNETLFACLFAWFFATVTQQRHNQSCWCDKKVLKVFLFLSFKKNHSNAIKNVEKFTDKFVHF